MQSETSALASVGAEKGTPILGKSGLVAWRHREEWNHADSVKNVPAGPEGDGGRGVLGARRASRRNGATTYYSHQGVDIAGVAGESSLYASLGGEVIFAGEIRDGGNTVIVNIGGGYRITYMHLESLNVATGDWVAKGQALGVLGQTGNAAGQPASEAHVHFEIRDGRRAVDPIRFLISPCLPGGRNL